MKTITYLHILILALTLSIIHAQTPEVDQVIISIPGYPYRFYSGYLDISLSSQAKSIHYVYFESQNNVAKDPIVVWLAGGPGCSGLINMLQENGPFTITPGNQRFTINQHAWNKRAGVVYFQGPAGVGYSQSLSNDTITDQIASLEIFNALRIFLDRHANVKKSQLYISGSGYGATIAGHVSRMIINSNKDQSLIYWSKINLKGLLLGNPCIYPGQCFASGSQRNSLYHYEFLYDRGFMPKKWYMQLIGKCMIPIDPYSCYVVRQKLDKQFNATNTSAYNIYAKCYNTSKKFTQNTIPNIINQGCEDEVGIIQYLNDPEHRKNWNIRDGKNWAPCNITIWNEYHSGNGTYHLLHDLIKDGLRLWVYSGDMDSTVPITGTKAWLNHFKTQYEIPIRKNWREWWIPGRHKGQDQVGGFIWEMEGLTAVLVKGAGFKASFDQPISMEIVINGFLDGKTLPYQA